MNLNRVHLGVRLCLLTPEDISDRAAAIMDAWDAQGRGFSEQLCNDAIDQAIQELGARTGEVK